MGPKKQIIKILREKIKFGPPPPGPLGAILRSLLVFFIKYGSETSDMTSEGLGEMFEGDSADT